MVTGLRLAVPRGGFDALHTSTGCVVDALVPASYLPFGLLTATVYTEVERGDGSLGYRLVCSEW